MLIGGTAAAGGIPPEGGGLVAEGKPPGRFVGQVVKLEGGVVGRLGICGGFGFDGTPGMPWAGGCVGSGGIVWWGGCVGRGGGQAPTPGSRLLSSFFLSCEL